MTIQELSELFNKQYIKATRTSMPEDYFRAALTSRQIIDLMGRDGLIEDSFDKEFEDQEGDV